MPSQVIGKRYLAMRLVDADAVVILIKDYVTAYEIRKIEERLKEIFHGQDFSFDCVVATSGKIIKIVYIKTQKIVARMEDEKNERN